MPQVIDYDEEDDANGGQLSSGGGSSGLGGGAPGGARQAESSKQQEAAFVPWSRFVSANESVSQREAGQLNSQVQGGIDRAKQAGDKAMDAFNNQVASNYERAPTLQEKGVADGKPQQFGAGKSAAGGFAGGKTPDIQAEVMGRGQAVAAPVHAPPKYEVGRLSYVPEATLAGVTDKARDEGPVGAKSLEESMGADAWSSLVGDTAKAQEQANALGSESGVQALLQQQGASPNSAFDAALINGAGQKQFGETAKTGGELGAALENRAVGAQNAWQQLLGDIDNAQAQKSQDELIAKGAADAAAANAPKGMDPEAAAKKQQLADGLTALRETPSFKKGYAAYGGTDGRPNGIGTKDDFLNAYANGGGPTDSMKRFTHPGDETQTTAGAMGGVANHLGIPEDQIIGMFEKMTDEQWADFWLLGIIPDGTPGVDPSRTGVPGGWQAPMIQGVLGYGEDGGMWNAITSMWKDSALIMAQAAAGGPAGAATGAVKAATYKGPGGSK